MKRYLVALLLSGCAVQHTPQPVEYPGLAHPTSWMDGARVVTEEKDDSGRLISRTESDVAYGDYNDEGKFVVQPDARSSHFYRKVTYAYENEGTLPEDVIIETSFHYSDTHWERTITQYEVREITRYVRSHGFEIIEDIPIDYSTHYLKYESESAEVYMKEGDRTDILNSNDDEDIKEITILDGNSVATFVQLSIDYYPLINLQCKDEMGASHSITWKLYRSGEVDEITYLIDDVVQYENKDADGFVLYHGKKYASGDNALSEKDPGKVCKKPIPLEELLLDAQVLLDQRFEPPRRHRRPTL